MVSITQTENNLYNTDIFEAARTGNLDNLNQIIYYYFNHNVSIDSYNDEGLTPLLLATREGHYDAVVLLIESGADPNLTTEFFEYSALSLALNHYHFDIFFYLLDYVQDMNSTCGDGLSILAKAASEGEIEVMGELLNRGAQINKTDNYSLIPLIEAVENNKIGSVQLLLDRGADINCQDNDGFTPLIIAAAYGHLDIVSYLLSHGANYNIRTYDIDYENDNYNAIEYAEIHGKQDSVNLILNFIKSQLNMV